MQDINNKGETERGSVVCWYGGMFVLSDLFCKPETAQKIKQEKKIN